MIKVRTKVGFGSKLEGTAEAHGSPLGVEGLRKVKVKLGFNPDVFFAVPSDVQEHMLEFVRKGEEAEKHWNDLFSAYKEHFSELAAEFDRRTNGNLPEGWESKVPSYSPKDKPNATRNSSGDILNALANVIPELIGGSADLTPSTKTWLKCSHDFEAGAYDGRYLRFGAREHAMAAIRMVWLRMEALFLLEQAF